ncbi:MAG: TetR/AcrR family transcriptional regulator C-terminal domain-containing protein [Oscillospiraceae bacterium]
MDTKKLIIDNYKELVHIRKTADISVSEICRSADISRKTFYNHFSDRYDLLKYIMLEEIEKPLCLALKRRFSNYDAMHMIFENLLLEKDFYKIAIMENCQNSLFDSLIECLSGVISANDIKPGLTKRETEYIDYKFAAEIVLMIRKWMSEGMNESPDFMSKICIYPKSR